MEKLNEKFIYYLFVLLSLSSLYLSSNSVTKIIGEFTLLAFFFIIVCLTIINFFYLKDISKQNIYIYSSSILFILICFTSILISDNPVDSILKLGTYVSSILVFIYFTFIMIKRSQLVFLFYTIGILSFIPFFNMIFSSNFIFRMANNNGIGMLLSFPFFLSLLLANKNKKYYLFSITFFLSILITSTRSVILAILFSFATFIIFKFIKNRFIYLLLILVTYLFVFQSILFYINFNSNKYFYYFNELSMKYSDKNLLSGREVIWNQAIILIKEKLYYGYGLGSKTSELLHINLSLHNFYFQLILQTGIIGLASFLILILCIFNAYFSENIRNEVLIPMAFFGGYLIQQNFEVFLFENNIYFGLLILITAGIGLAIKKNKGSVDL